MSSRQEIIDSLTAFYEEVLKQPYLDDSTLRIPPPSGWTTVDVGQLQDRGKTDGTIDLLRHLPYLAANDQYQMLLIQSDTTPLAYNKDPSMMMEEVNPLPGHCVYLTEGVDARGFSLILDTEKGTITLYSTTGDEIPEENRADYDGMAEGDKWKAHRTLPAAQLLQLWTKEYARLVNMLTPNVISGPTTGSFYGRALSRGQREQMADQTGSFQRWEPDMETAVCHIEDEQMRQHQMAREQHVAALYSCFLRHGWPDSFNKSACMTEIIGLEKREKAREREFLDVNNPDADFFDD